MKRPGIIISVISGKAIVVMKHMYACSGRHADCPWNALLGNVVPREFHVEAENPIRAKPGQTVEVDYPATSLTQNAFYVYLLPLLTMFAGYLMGSILSSLFGYMAGSASLVAGFFITKHLDMRLKEEYVISNIITYQMPSCLTPGCAPMHL